MKKVFISIMFLSTVFLFCSGCSVIEGRPDKDNIEQAEGSTVWWNARQDYEFNASQLDNQFGDQPGDENFASPDAIDMDAQKFNFKDQ